MTTITAAITETVIRLRTQVATLHGELVRYQLVVWTAGNISARVPGHDLLVIKPSGVSYDALTPASMIVCDLDGDTYRRRPGAVQRHRRPRVRLPAHAPHRRRRTHPLHLRLRLGRPRRAVPCVLTAMADEFGAEIPVGPFALIGDDSIGQGIVETLNGHRSPAVLMRNHGVFTIGPDARAAVKAAVMCEDVARTVHLSRTARRTHADRATDIDQLYHRYQNAYGQH